MDWLQDLKKKITRWVLSMQVLSCIGKWSLTFNINPIIFVNIFYFEAKPKWFLKENGDTI